jgi:hypothetical protein
VRLDAGGARVNVNDSLPYHLQEAREASEAVRVDAVAVGLREESRTQLGAPLLEADLEQGAPQCLMKLVEADSQLVRFDQVEVAAGAFDDEGVGV